MFPSEDGFARHLLRPLGKVDGARAVSNSWVVPSGTGVSCGPPLHVANGVVRGAVFQFGDVAAYSCFGGYAMEGVGRSRCLENGTWTPPPTCRGREKKQQQQPLFVWQKGRSPSSGHFLLPMTEPLLQHDLIRRPALLWTAAHTQQITISPGWH